MSPSALADDLHEGETLEVEGVAVTLREDVCARP